MSKSILIIDTPENCKTCGYSQFDSFYNQWECMADCNNVEPISDEYIKEIRSPNCPLKDSTNSKQLYEALNVIKQYCSENENCEKCVLSIGIGNKCVCQTANIEHGIFPADWKIKEPTEYKAFDENEGSRRKE